MDCSFPSVAIYLLCNSPFRAVTDLHFNYVTSDWRATIVNGFFPFKIHVCFTPVNNIRSTWRKWHSEGIFCNDRSQWLQIIRFTLWVNSPNSEFILFAWLQIITFDIASWRCSYQRPNSSVSVIFLNNVVLNWATSIILRWLPSNLASILMNTSDIHWPLWGSWGSNNIHSDFSSILAMNIYSMDLINSIILPCCFINIHWCFVRLVSDCSCIRITECFTILWPICIRCRLTYNINIKAKWLTNPDSYFSQSFPVNSRFECFVAALEIVRFRPWWSNTSKVFCSYAEVISLSNLNTSCLSSFILLFCFSTFHPNVFIGQPLFNNVVEYLWPTIPGRLCPFEIKEVMIIINTFWFSWGTRRIIRILGQYCVTTFKVVRFTFSIDCLDFEHVLMALLKTFNCYLKIKSLATGNPLLTAYFHLFNNIVSNWRSTIIFWNLPVNCDPVCIDVLILHWSCWFIWWANTQNIEICFISAIFVFGLKSVDPCVFPPGSDNMENCFMRFHSNVKVSWRFYFSWAKPPNLFRVRLTTNFDIQLKWLTTFNLNIIHIGSVDNWRSISCFASDLFRWFRWLPRSSTINSLDSEFIFTMFSKVSTFGFAFISVCVHMFEPLWAEFFLSFNNIVCDSWATIIKRRFPWNLNPFSIPVINFRFLWRTRRVIGILCTNGSISFKWFTFSLIVNSLHSEEVEAAFLETFNIKLCSLAFCLSTRQPYSLFCVHFFHDIIFYWISTVILWWPPVKMARMGCNVGNFKWSHRLSGNTNNKDFAFSFIWALVVLDQDPICACITAGTFSDH